MIEFEEFPKIPRLRRDCVVTEKIDGTNASVHLAVAAERDEPDHNILRTVADADGMLLDIRAGSRTRWVKPGKETDNFGFAAWAYDNAEELVKLGPGAHFGEWYGAGIQRTYGLTERRFALFNTARWNPLNPNRPACCGVVPVLYTGPLGRAERVLMELRNCGSVAVPGFMDPEGIVVYHAASRSLFKATCQHDDEPKTAYVKKERVPQQLRPKGDRRRNAVEYPEWAERRKAA